MQSSSDAKAATNETTANNTSTTSTPAEQLHVGHSQLLLVQRFRIQPTLF
jgi:hypothetical protein